MSMKNSLGVKSDLLRNTNICTTRSEICTHLYSLSITTMLLVVFKRFLNVF